MVFPMILTIDSYNFIKLLSVLRLTTSWTTEGSEFESW
jgi:hypothetical protein